MEIEENKLIGLKKSSHGIFFQLGVIEYALIELLRSKKQFTLESENSETYPKFEDIVLKIENEIYAFQVKHSFDKDKKLTIEDFKSGPRYNLVKHFEGWKKIVNKDTMKFYFITNQELSCIKKVNITDYVKDFVRCKNEKIENIKKNINDINTEIDTLLNNILTRTIDSIELDKLHKIKIEEIIKNEFKNEGNKRAILEVIGQFVQYQKDNQVGKYTQISNFWQKGQIDIEAFINGAFMKGDNYKDALIKLVKSLNDDQKDKLREIIEDLIKENEDSKKIIKSEIQQYINNLIEISIDNQGLIDWNFNESENLNDNLKNILQGADDFYVRELKDKIIKDYIFYQCENLKDFFKDFEVFQIHLFQFEGPLNSQDLFQIENDLENFKIFLKALKIIKLPDLDDLTKNSKELFLKFYNSIDDFNRLHIHLEKWFISSKYKLTSSDFNRMCQNW